MKRKTFYKIFAFLLTATIFFSACKKEEDVKLDPQLATTQVLSVTSNAATVVGFVIAAGDGFTEKGVCYNTATAPTVSNKKVVYTGTASAATFNVALSGLTYATKYYARAYATNANGTIYGEEFSFTTSPVLPTVTTAEITEITGTTAIGGGNVTNNGGADITARGICFGLTANPTVADGKTVDGNGSGEFVSSLAKLSGLTTYHVRAYAQNSVGLSYGNDIEFTTLVAIRTWNLPGDYVAASYPGSSYADWAPDKSPQVISLESAPDNLEGYVYMANLSNNWKFATQPNWNGPNYANNDASGNIEPGVLDPNAANNINSPMGYYKINANAKTLTYTAVATNWGVIGSASPLAWDDETALTYDPVSRTWTGGMHMTVGEFKFRANHSWDYNYGSNSKDANLNAGGDNIPLTFEADYFFILDLSIPNTYTYSANMWGLIGSAVPVTQWDSDQNLNWDNTSKALVITLDLQVGEIKFRANDNWNYNLGGDIAALTNGGDNIAVSAAGNYTISLFLAGTPHCTIVKNSKKKK